MSLLYSKPNTELNDFYESFQGIHDSYETNDGFGKYVPDNLSLRNVKKICSSQNVNTMLAYDDGNRRCYSTQSFQDECEIQNYYGKSHYGYRLEDHSTMGSFSSMTSIHSHTPGVQVLNAGPSTTNTTATSGNNNKGKSKGGKKKNSGDIDYRKKYKTEPCKYWTEKGFCEYGDQCAFAHGTGEMRQKPHLSSNYKTKKCNQFHETGYCPYGVRCQFIHSILKDCQLNPTLEKISYTEAMENPELWITHDPDCVCMQKKSRPRLPSFQQCSSSTADSSSDVNKESDSLSDKSLENLTENSM